MSTAKHPAHIDALLQIATSDKPVRNSTTTEPYRGTELRTTSNRAGAQDAYRLPSRTFYGTRTPGKA